MALLEVVVDQPETPVLQGGVRQRLRQYLPVGELRMQDLGETLDPCYETMSTLKPQ